MKSRQIKYTADELTWIESHKRMIRRESHALFVEKFGRDDVSLVNFNALCKRKGWMTGRTGQIEKGAQSWNKGKKMPFHPNSAKTQFKSGREPHNTKHLGYERTTPDGYIEISIAETNPHTGYSRRFALKHRHEWEKANGPFQTDTRSSASTGTKRTAPHQTGRPFPAASYRA